MNLQTAQATATEMIAVIDNYDSFTWNLADMLQQGGMEVRVFRNDAISVSDLWELAPAGILLSPGPGRPENSGVSGEVLAAFASSVPILGICLGHQLLGVSFGMQLGFGTEPMHGKTSSVIHDQKGVFSGMPSPFRAMRYHSLLLQGPASQFLEITARTTEGEIMGIRHKSLPVEGLQFHPESILTKEGGTLITNWLEIVRLHGQSNSDRF